MYCIRCDYDLRELSQDGKCPECGQDIIDSLEFPPFPTGANIRVTRLGDDVYITVVRNRLIGVLIVTTFGVLLLIGLLVGQRHSAPLGWLTIAGVFVFLMICTMMLRVILSGMVHFVVSPEVLTIREHIGLRTVRSSWGRSDIDGIMRLLMHTSKEEGQEHQLRIWFTDDRDAQVLMEDPSAEVLEWVAIVLNRVLRLEAPDESCRDQSME